MDSNEIFTIKLSKVALESLSDIVVGSISQTLNPCLNIWVGCGYKNCSFMENDGNHLGFNYAWVEWEHGIDFLMDISMIITILSENGVNF